MFGFQGKFPIVWQHLTDRQKTWVSLETQRMCHSVGCLRTHMEDRMRENKRGWGVYFVTPWFLSLSALWWSHTPLFFTIFIASGKLKTKTTYQFSLMLFTDFTEIRPLLREISDLCAEILKKNPLNVIFCTFNVSPIKLFIPLSILIVWHLLTSNCKLFFNKKYWVARKQLLKDRYGGL